MTTPTATTTPILSAVPGWDAPFDGGCWGLPDEEGPLPELEEGAVGLTDDGSGEEGSVRVGPPEDAGGVGEAEYEEPDAGPEGTAGGGVALLCTVTAGTEEASAGGGAVWTPDSEGETAGIVG